MKKEKEASYPTTPDGRYFVVRGKLWRSTNPALDEAKRTRLVHQLMIARREVNIAMKKRSHDDIHLARDKVNRAKVALGERGPVWWTDGAEDYNQHLVTNTPYADWYRGLGEN